MRPQIRSRLARHPQLTVVAIGLVAVACWVPTVGVPPSPDESGFLMVAGQWDAGSSLYGDYWVDRPPLLLMLFALADAAGGLTALRLLGLAMVFLSVVLASHVGRLVAPTHDAAPWIAAATAAIFIANPLFGRGAVNGEILALPFVLAGLVALLAARARAGRRSAIALWAGAGAAASAAVLVKQNFVEVFLVAVVLLVLPVSGVRRARSAAAFVCGAVAAPSLVLLFAGSRGTDPMALWEAVVSFRFQASAVIGSSASAATPTRAARLVVVLLITGALPLIVLGGRRIVGFARPDRLDLRLVAAVLVFWEGLAIAGGGSYWLHYLMGLVPALVTVVALATSHPEQRQGASRALRPRVLVYPAAVSLSAQVVVALLPVPTHAGVSDYLAARGGSGDTAVVAFGSPDILYGAGMSSPYPLLWSLPVRVRDPHLRQLIGVLSSPDRPTWVVTGSSGLSGWGLSPSDWALRRFARLYKHVAEVDDHAVFRARRHPDAESSR